MSEYITLISPPDETVNFKTQFDTTIALNDDFEVGLTEIFHGSVCNVCSDNNTFYITSFKLTSRFSENLTPHLNSTKLTIPPGYYKNSIHVMEAMKESIDVWTSQGGRGGTFLVDDLDTPRTELVYVAKSKNQMRANPIGPYEDEILSTKLTLTDRDLRFYHPKQGQLLTLLGKQVEGTFNEIHVANTALDSTDEIGLIYCSLVKSSRLNNKNTNLLAIIPLAQNADSNYTHYSVINPTYYPIAVTSFERIHIEIRNVVQKPIHIQHLSGKDRSLYPTIITLHLRKRL